MEFIIGLFIILLIIIVSNKIKSEGILKEKQAERMANHRARWNKYY